MAFAPVNVDCFSIGLFQTFKHLSSPLQRKQTETNYNTNVYEINKRNNQNGLFWRNL